MPRPALWAIFAVAMVAFSAALSLTFSPGLLPSPPAGPHGFPSGPASPAPGAARTAVTSISSPRSHTSSNFGPTTGPEWTNLTSTLSGGPSGRTDYSMTYDYADGYLLLYGGRSNCCVFGDTWALEGHNWTNLTPAHLNSTNTPGPRVGAALTYDAADGYVVLFGGGDNQTWKFINGTWSNLSLTHAPPASSFALAAYDSVGGRVVIFGGDPSGVCIPGNPYYKCLQETWQYSGGMWTDLTPSPINSTNSPPAQTAAYGRMAMDPSDNGLLFEGTGGTWVFSGSNWTHLKLAVEPAYVYGIAMSFEPTLGMDVTVGVGNSLNSSETFFDENWTPIQTSSNPSGRFGEQLVWDPDWNASILFGGQGIYVCGVVLCGDTWAFSTPGYTAQIWLEQSQLEVNQSLTEHSTPWNGTAPFAYTYTSLPPGCLSTNASVLTCNPSGAGEFDLRVNITDRSGAVATASSNVTVHASLSGAISTDKTILDIGESTNISATPSGGFGPYTYYWQGLPGGCSGGNASEITCTPTAQGSFRPNLSINDSLGGHSEIVGQTINVSGTPSIVTFNSRPSVIDLGSSISLNATVQGGSPPLAFAYSGLPSNCTTVNGPVLICAPSTAGSFTIKLNVTDASGRLLVGSASVTVNPLPSITAFSVTPNATDAGQSLRFSLNATGGTGKLTFSYSGLPPGCALGNTAGGVCSPSVGGPYQVTATAVDTLGKSANASLSVLVAPALALTSVAGTPTSVDVGEAWTIQLAFVGGTSPFSFNYTGLPPGACSGVTTSTVVCQPSKAGVFTVVATVRDGLGATSQMSGAVTVASDPSVTSFEVSATSILANSSVTFTANVNGGSGTYSFAYTGLPPGCASENLSVLTCTPTTAGAYNVTVNVTDSHGVSSRSFALLSVEANSPSVGSPGTSSSGSSEYLEIGGAAGLLVVVAAAVLILRRKSSRSGPSPDPANDFPDAAGQPPETQT